MGSRADLHNKLKTVLGSDHVYYQPPADVRMVYPAIIYSLNRIENRHAGNVVYGQNRSYDVTVVDRVPDSTIAANLSKDILTSFDRQYVADGLYHTVFTIYY